MWCEGPAGTEVGAGPLEDDGPAEVCTAVGARADGVGAGVACADVRAA